MNFKDTKKNEVEIEPILVLDVIINLHKNLYRDVQKNIKNVIKNHNNIKITRNEEALKISLYSSQNLVISLSDLDISNSKLRDSFLQAYTSATKLFVKHNLLNYYSKLYFGHFINTKSIIKEIIFEDFALNIYLLRMSSLLYAIPNAVFGMMHDNIKFENIKNIDHLHNCNIIQAFDGYATIFFSSPVKYAIRFSFRNLRLEFLNLIKISKNEKLVVFDNFKIIYLQWAKLIKFTKNVDDQFIQKMWNKNYKEIDIKLTIELNTTSIIRLDKFIYGDNQNYKCINSPYYCQLLINDKFWENEKFNTTQLKIKYLKKIREIDLVFNNKSIDILNEKEFWKLFSKLNIRKFMIVSKSENEFISSLFESYQNIICKRFWISKEQICLISLKERDINIK